jgi:hypothetical protein
MIFEIGELVTRLLAGNTVSLIEGIEVRDEYRDVPVRLVTHS